MNSLKEIVTDFEAMFGLFALAGEGDPAGGRVDETSDEHSLGGAFTGDILRHFVVQLVGPQHVATVPVHTINNNNIIELSS